ncbi:leucyl aminopeptidase [Pseudemcibacter aquimaris]|uniref:leucyl aminopeptidase n=1 Tax=Pseudemcibacter aquimaris TaxID=2857064 RepID=UPI0020137DD0|nr:leucyl aminopeptidase [Pseudemcibacter aquimaris]MCC3859958.1 leucyl aminopeptidase [Pseudemcibacter aquimaris]WDU57290.1 leucyl aminopeptidase [Pseudemcibacter aquimaris]
MKINFTEIDKDYANIDGAVVVFSLKNDDGYEFRPPAVDLDKATDGALTKAAEATDFKGNFGQMIELIAPSGVAASRILLVGLGEMDKLNPLKAEQIGGKVIVKLMYSGEKNVTVVVGKMAESAALGMRLRAYKFDKYFTTEKNIKKPSVEQVTFQTHGADEAAAKFETMDRVADGVFWARDLVTEPGNVVYPESYAAQIKELTNMGIEVEVLDEDTMEDLGMESLLGVGQGSASESLMVLMHWKGSDNPDEAPVAFVGKGVTFDTGGISLKPGAGMGDMKFDMGGSAAVVGAMKAIAGRKAKANVIGVVGLVENMPSSTAQRPGDVVGSMSGQTIEVLNTDAEGRLVLADCLWYTQDRYKPKFIVDLATLTGAMMVALGQEFAGMFSNSDELCEMLDQAGKDVDEPLWRMPLTDGFDKMINSDIADMKNIGGKYGGSITAAQFLQRFVNETPWAHLDIAGTAWRQKPSDVAEKGATGYGVRLLDRLVQNNFED